MYLWTAHSLPHTHTHTHTVAAKVWHDAGKTRTAMEAWVKVTPCTAATIEQTNQFQSGFDTCCQHQSKNRHSMLLLNHTLEPFTSQSTHWDTYTLASWDQELLRLAPWNNKNLAKQLTNQSWWIVALTKACFYRSPNSKWNSEIPTFIQYNHPSLPIHPTHLCQLFPRLPRQ